MQLDLAATLARHREGRAARILPGPHGRTRSPPRCVKAGGIMTKDDLANYRPIERAVVRGSYRGYDIISVPPPSSGGVHLIEMLNILEGYDLARLSREQSLARHDRGDEARLCRSRRVHGRPRRGEDAGRWPDLESIRDIAARTASARERRRRPKSAPATRSRFRRPQHHAFLGDRP